MIDQELLRAYKANRNPHVNGRTFFWNMVMLSAVMIFSAILGLL